MPSRAELLERNLNNALLHAAGGQFEEGFAVYQKLAAEWPDEPRVWQGWLDFCYEWIETERCIFYKEDSYDVRTMQQVYEHVLARADESARAAIVHRWDEFWTNVADSAWAGEQSLFHVAPTEWAVTGTFDAFSRELALVGEVHPRLAEVIAEGCQLAADLTRAGVCFWLVEYLSVRIGERIWQINRDFPNLKIPPQNPRLHYFHNIKFWR